MKKVRGVFEKIPGSGIWWTLWYDGNGKRHREKVGRKSAALRRYQKQKTLASEGKKFPANIRAKDVLFKEIADDALSYSKIHKRDYYNDKVRIPRLTAEFGTREADSITHQQIEMYLETISNSPATFNRWRALWSMIYREGVRNKKVTSNPAKLVRARDTSGNARKRYLTDAEEAKLTKIILQRCPRHLPEFIIALHTGMRRGEQFTLSWEQVSFKRRTIHLTRTKNGGERIVPINASALTAFKRLGSGSGPVFLTSRKNVKKESVAIKNARTWFDDVVAESGLRDVTWHTLRHTFASRLVMAGVDIRTVQELMGHKTLQMTVRYSHLAPSHTLSAVERLTAVKAQQPPKQPPRKKAAPKRAA